jgi:hypothetical protein
MTRSHACCRWQMGSALKRLAPMPANSTPGDGYQRHRACHQASDHHEKEFVVRESDAEARRWATANTLIQSCGLNGAERSPTSPTSCNGSSPDEPRTTHCMHCCRGTGIRHAHRCIAPLSSSPFCGVAASLPAILTRRLAVADPTGAIDTATARVDQELRDGRPQHQQPDAMDRPARGLQLPGAWRLARGA